MSSFSSSAFRRLLQSDNALGALLAATAFAVYLTTLAPTVGFTDAGELAAVAATFGIAHPTGYPLFTLVAGAFASLPSGETVVWRLNLFAALCCAASVFFFFRFFLALLHLERQGNRKSQGAIVDEVPLQAAAGIGALTLAFSRTFWEQATGVEVYSLHLLMVSLVLWLFTVSTKRATHRVTLTNSGVSKGSVGASRAWFLFAFCLGLSFANHMTTVLLLPGLAWLYFASHGFVRASWLRLAKAVPLFLAGLMPYLYLPLRAAAEPLLNWGNPVSVENFWRHVTGQQYRVWMFSSFDAALAQLTKFLTAFPEVFGVAPLLLMVAGLAVLALRNFRLFAFTLLLFLTCVFYAVNYDIHDISNYFLLAYVAAAFWVARGVLVALEFFAPRFLAGWGRRVAVAALAGLCVIPPLALNHGAVDESDNRAVEDYAHNMFASLDSNATLLTTQWDLFVSAAYYLQQVEGMRPDVTILDRELLRRSWYLTQLRGQDPDLARAAEVEIDAFLRAVRPFERGEPYAAAVIQHAYEEMVRALLREGARRGSLYVTPEIERVYWREFNGVPSGLAFHLFTGGESPLPGLISFHVRPLPDKQSTVYTEIRRAYAAAYMNMAYQQGAAGNLDAVRPLLHKALELSPGFPPATGLLRQLDAATVPTVPSGPAIP